MKKLNDLWIELHSSFWFIPLLFVILSIIMAMALVEIDIRYGASWINHWPRLFGAGAEASRGMLSTIANSVMSMMTVSFSMTLVTLALASSQYTSRILRNFMRSRKTQSSLGIFAGIFTYCLIVLRTIRGTETYNFIPRLAVLVGFSLAVFGVAVLAFFIHHIASSIQTSSILANIFEETVSVIDELFQNERSRENIVNNNIDENQFLQPVYSRKTGYIQSIDFNSMLNFARKAKCVLKLNCEVGSFIHEHSVILYLNRKNASIETCEAKIRSFFTVKRYRTIEQDPLFGIRQIVDIALKALSPGINDTTTAVMCIEYLFALLIKLSSKHFPSPFRYNDNELAIVEIKTEFKIFLCSAFEQIRNYSSNNIAIMTALLRGYMDLLNHVTNEETRNIIISEKNKLSEIIDSMPYSADKMELKSLFNFQLTH